MSWNYYCYGQIKDKENNWKEFSTQPFSDNLKYYIDFDDVPDVFQRIRFNDTCKDMIAPHFLEEFKDEEFCHYEGYFVQLDDFNKYYYAKIKSISDKITTIMNCMGLETDGADILDSDSIWNIYELNEKTIKHKTIPICKSAILDLVKMISELDKYQYLVSMSKVFETMAYTEDNTDWKNEKKSFLIVML